MFDRPSEKKFVWRIFGWTCCHSPSTSNIQRLVSVTQYFLSADVDSITAVFSLNRLMSRTCSSPLIYFVSISKKTVDREYEWNLLFPSTLFYIDINSSFMLNKFHFKATLLSCILIAMSFCLWRSCFLRNHEWTLNKMKKMKQTIEKARRWTSSIKPHIWKKMMFGCG